MAPSSRPWRLASAQFSYSTGYTVTTGVGFSAGGSKGGTSASGSTTTSDTETVVYRPAPGACFLPGGHGGGYWTYAWYLIEDAVGGSAADAGSASRQGRVLLLVERPCQRHRGSLHGENMDIWCQSQGVRLRH
jgi:hypothetical protein